MTTHFQNTAALDQIVDQTIQKIGTTIVLATPLAGGKPNLLINAFYRRAKQDPRIQLQILTALTLQKPQGQSLLEKRFLEPLVERVFKDYPDLDYEIDRTRHCTPSNVQIIEFYYPAGKYLHHPDAQQNYLSSNYTHVARDMRDRGVNVIAQMLCRPEEGESSKDLSLGSNPDVTLDLIRELRKQNSPLVILGQINQKMPYMYGDSVVSPTLFDHIIDIPEHYYELFSPPKMSVSDTDYIIGLYASSLVKDDGELQIGIGALGDSVVSSLILRHEKNDLYKSILKDLQLYEKFPSVFRKWGDDTPFQCGLFGATEMLVDGFMELYRHGILKKKVYDDIDLQRLLNQKVISEIFSEEFEKIQLLKTLLNQNIIQSPLTPNHIEWLKRWGIFKMGVSLRDGPYSIPVDLTVEENLKTLAQEFMGDSLIGGHLVHAGFFMGPRSFYEWLRKMPAKERALFSMRSVQKINQLYGHEDLDRLHRKNARFINTCMITTLLGAHASDALSNGQVVSGVGGQYNFVAMAQELPDGRSLLTMRATRHQHGKLVSNIVSHYGHTTIPRHLRDILITEYGIADLRGKTDSEIIQELLKVTDSRFQQELLNTAIQHGKLPATYQIPEAYRKNLPQTLHPLLLKYKRQGAFPPYPFGTDLTPEEQVLGRALKLLKALMRGSKLKLFKTLCQALLAKPSAAERPLLERLELWNAPTLRERFYGRLLTLILRRSMNFPKA